MNYVFVNNAEPKTKRVSRSSSAGKSQKLEKYEKRYLDRLEKQSQTKADSTDEE